MKAKESRRKILYEDILNTVDMCGVFTATLTLEERNMWEDFVGRYGVWVALQKMRSLVARWENNVTAEEPDFTKLATLEISLREVARNWFTALRAGKSPVRGD